METKTYFLNKFLVFTFWSEFLKDKKSQRSHKTGGMKNFLPIFASSDLEQTDPDLKGPKTSGSPTLTQVLEIFVRVACWLRCTQSHKILSLWWPPGCSDYCSYSWTAGGASRHLLCYCTWSGRPPVAMKPRIVAYEVSTSSGERAAGSWASTIPYLNN